MAEYIRKGMEQVSGVEARTFALSDIDRTGSMRQQLRDHGLPHIYGEHTHGGQGLV